MGGHRSCRLLVKLLIDSCAPRCPFGTVGNALPDSLRRAHYCSCRSTLYRHSLLVRSSATCSVRYFYVSSSHCVHSERPVHVEINICLLTCALTQAYESIYSESSHDYS